MKNVTLDELVQNVKGMEALIEEPKDVEQMIICAAMEVGEAAKSGKVKILTDYDADGICSAYIMEKTLKAINPECNVEVECNDRRGSYGLSPDIQGEADTRYIICDMGSNQLDLARERLGENVIILDHHIIEDEENRKAFMSLEPSTNSSCLCNPHALHKDDSQNAQYCATGLAYRVYQESERLCKLYEKPFHTDEKQDNTVAVMACIGTATDMVNVLDLNSKNREILKDGLQRIDNADEENLDFVIGNILAKNKIADNVTAHQLAFNVGAFLNSASRMSEIAQENGAMRMYNAITADPTKASTYKEIDALMEQNRERKNLISQLTSEQAYKDFIDEHRFGAKANDNIAVYQLPDNVPHAFAGLVAGKLAEATDKAILCVTYSEKTGAYSGSGRNVPSNETSLMEFMKFAVADADAVLDIQYGGHEDAIGISHLDDITLFKESVERNASHMVAKDFSDKTFLSISLKDIASDETMAKMQEIEPVGVGLEIPPAIFKGNETYRDKLFKAGRDDWKSVKLTDPETKTSVQVADWAYTPKAYPQSGKKGNEVAVVAELSINDYKGQHVELSAKTDRAFFAERVKEVELEKNQKSPKKGSVEHDT